jgi:alkylhydroperoxidase/carboxymuconolactone decarboxylase family protein YurZ
MIARIAAAATITHLAHAAGNPKMAKAIMAAANKNRQKQSFMISPPLLIEAF